MVLVNMLGIEGELDGQTSFYNAGKAMALSRDGTVVAFAMKDEASARVYKWNGSSWNKLGTDGDLDGQAGTSYGKSVALNANGTIIVIGAHEGGPYDTNVQHDPRGEAIVYKWNGSKWERIGARNNSGAFVDELIGAHGTYMGERVDISADGTIVAIGGRGSGNERGIIKLYKWNGANWNILTQIYGKIDFSHTITMSLSSEADIIAVGMRSGGGDFAGDLAGYVYTNKKNILMGDLTVSNDLTVGSDLTVSNDLIVAEYIIHKDDANTYIRFESDSIKFVRGGREEIKTNDLRVENMVKIGRSDNEIVVPNLVITRNYARVTDHPGRGAYYNKTGEFWDTESAAQTDVSSDANYELFGWMETSTSGYPTILNLTDGSVTFESQKHELIDDSYALLRFNITGPITIKYWVDSEEDYDKLYIFSKVTDAGSTSYTVGTWREEDQISGQQGPSSGSENTISWTDDASRTFIIVYAKDHSIGKHSDQGYIRVNIPEQAAATGESGRLDVDQVINIKTDQRGEARAYAPLVIHGVYQISDEGLDNSADPIARNEQTQNSYWNATACPSPLLRGRE